MIGQAGAGAGGLQLEPKSPVRRHTSSSRKRGRSQSPEPRRPRNASSEGGISNASGGSKPTLTISTAFSTAVPTAVSTAVSMPSPPFSNLHTSQSSNGERRSLSSPQYPLPAPSPTSANELAAAEQPAPAHATLADLSRNPVSASAIPGSIVSVAIPDNSSSQPAPHEPAEPSPAGPQVSRASQDESFTVHTDPDYMQNSLRDEDKVIMQNSLPDKDKVMVVPEMFESPFLQNHSNLLEPCEARHTVLFLDGQAYRTSNKSPNPPVYLQPGMTIDLLTQSIEAQRNSLQSKEEELVTAKSDFQTEESRLNRQSKGNQKHFQRMRKTKETAKILAKDRVTEKEAEIATIQATLKTSRRIVDSITPTNPLLRDQELPAFHEIGNSPIGNTGDESFSALSDEVLTKIGEDKTTVGSIETTVG